MDITFIHLIKMRTDNMNMQNKDNVFQSIMVDNKENIPPVKKISIGTQLKAIRTKKKLTLKEASKLTRLATSTLSKIENEQVSPTFTVMQKLASGFNIELPQLFIKPRVLQATARRDITLCDTGKAHLTSTYEHELLATKFSNKKMIPYKSRVYARCFDDFGEWVRHEGEELLLVLEGEIQFLSEFYEAITLSKGDNVYFDATMGHLIVSVSKKDALILSVSAK
jgi:transcriptional regulator with XRE-family HTH domain